MIKSILSSIIKAGGTPYIVGGYVRDLVMGLTPKDIDVETFGISIEKLSEVLSSYGEVDFVGKSFGVLKLSTNSGEHFDFSLPRRENKVGVGHRDFEIEVNSSMTFAEASLRCDFTINSMGLTADGQIVDPQSFAVVLPLVLWSQSA